MTTLEKLNAKRAQVADQFRRRTRFVVRGKDVEISRGTPDVLVLVWNPRLLADFHAELREFQLKEAREILQEYGAAVDDSLTVAAHRLGALEDFVDANLDGEP